MKLYDLKNIKQCPFKAYISKFELKTMDKKSAMIRATYKNILTLDNFLKLDKDTLKDAIFKELNNSYFLTEQEKDVEIMAMFKYLLRYQEYENKLHRRILSKDIYSDVEIEDNKINVRADIVFENSNSIEIVKYKTNATKLSYKARTEKNLPENDIELFLLKKMGEKIYSKFNKPIISSYYHLRGKSEDKEVYKHFLEDKNILINETNALKSMVCHDKKEQKKVDKEIKAIEDVLYFENSKGNNIITFDYNKDLSDEILKLCNTELNAESEKCQSSDCEFCDYSTICNYKKENNQNTLEIIQEVKKSSGETQLTDNQKEVVDIENGTYRINAVAGSGKSTTMVLRTIELFKKGYSPNDILMITFTNKGCEELKEKIGYWLNYYNIQGVNIKDLNIFTFNGFGDNILSKEWSKLGFTQKPQLATTIDVNDVIKELLEEYSDIEWLNYKNPLLNYPNSKGAFKQLSLYFNAIKSYGIDDIELSEEVDKKVLFDIYNKFNEKLKNKNLLQYQDQVLYLIELFGNDSNLIESYGYKHIIVDEYQDTDFTQVELLHLLKQYKECKSFMVVGDDSQAIYSFRNTTPENILKFHKEFKNVKDINLLDNFRSTPQICNVANSLIKLNTQRIDKDIVSKKTNGRIPELLKFKTLDEERNYIVNLIQEKISNEVPKYEICYIGRTKKELLELQKQLKDKNVPSIVEASELYIDNINVQCIINLANFFKNNDYDYYLMEYAYIASDEFKDMNFDKKNESVNKLKDKTLTELNEFAKEDNAEELKIDYFYNMIGALVKNDRTVYSFIENIKSKTFYTFNELLNYLYKIALYKDDTSIEKDENKYDAIVLTTAHSSKGKEWSVVINSIDNYKYDVNEKELEEERRLLFVSMTRAKDELYITYNTSEDKARNKGKYCKFADELENVEKIEIE
ncbi:ATP-dependent helicase [Clostridium botulinum]|uniref:ATP-dependent helicase n=1 Tax=Clostridium botulinum TaxID=1491 RepID=UPI00196722AA|nr:ATP-dependent helicase [Clostridium botulinum]MBN1074691.1 ATP-dependent helicase [Clostridium botulinum]